MKVLWNHRFKRSLKRSSAATFAISISILMRTILSQELRRRVENDVIYTTPRLLSSLWIWTSPRPCSYACLSAATGLWECQRGYLIEAKGGGIWGRASARRFKGPYRHLGLDKRTWQISTWSPVYYISVRTPSASLPLCTFISDTDILT